MRFLLTFLNINSKYMKFNLQLSMLLVKIKLRLTFSAPFPLTTYVISFNSVKNLKYLFPIKLSLYRLFFNYLQRKFNIKQQRLHCIRKMLIYEIYDLKCMSIITSNRQQSQSQRSEGGLISKQTTINPE